MFEEQLAEGELPMSQEDVAAAAVAIQGASVPVPVHAPAPAPERKASLWERVMAVNYAVELISSDEADPSREIVEQYLEAVEGQSEKVDACYAFLSRCEAEADRLSRESARLEKMANGYRKTAESVSDSILRAIMSRPPDKAGNYPDLSGSHVVFRAAKKPERLDVYDEDKVPQAWKRVTVQVEYPRLLQFVQCLPLDLGQELLASVKSSQVLRQALLAQLKTDREQAAAIAAGKMTGKVEPIPGAKIADRSFRLVIVGEEKEVKKNEQED